MSKAITRRTVLKSGLLWAIVGQLACTNSREQLSGLTLQLEGTQRTIFNSLHKQYLSQLVDTIIPETETPSASQVGVVEFIDMMLSEWASQYERDVFLLGLDEFIFTTENGSGLPFLQMSDGARLDYLLALQEKSEQMSLGAYPSFISLIKGFAVYGYYTSEIGALAELRFNLVPGVLDTCQQIEIEEHAPALSISNTFALTYFKYDRRLGVMCNASI